MKHLLLAADNQIALIARLCLASKIGVEIQAFHDPSLSDRDPEALDRHAAAIANIAARALHGPFYDLCPGSFDAMVREVARDRFELGYRNAERLEVNSIVFHHGYVPGTSRAQGWLRRCSSFWRDFLVGKAPDVRFHLENGLERDPALLADVIAAIDDRRADVCLDIGHAHCHSNLGVMHWIERLGSMIGHVHLHDNHGTEDEHLGLGEGNIPLQAVCEALNHHAPQASWTLEVPLDRLTPSLNWLRERGFLEG